MSDVFGRKSEVVWTCTKFSGHILSEESERTFDQTYFQRSRSTKLKDQLFPRKHNYCRKLRSDFKKDHADQYLSINTAYQDSLQLLSAYSHWGNLSEEGLRSIRYYDRQDHVYKISCRLGVLWNSYMGINCALYKLGTPSSDRFLHLSTENVR